MPCDTALYGLNCGLGWCEETGNYMSNESHNGTIFFYCCWSVVYVLFTTVTPQRARKSVSACVRASGCVRACGDETERQKESESYNLMIAHCWVQLTGCEMMMMMMKSRCDVSIKRIDTHTHTITQIWGSDSKANMSALERFDLLGSRCLVGSELLAARQSKKGQKHTNIHADAFTHSHFYTQLFSVVHYGFSV